MKEGKRPIVIDGVTEVDDLTFVSHFAQGDSNKIKELYNFKKNYSNQTDLDELKLSHFNNELEESDVSDSEGDTLDGVVSTRSTPQSSQSYQDTRDPLDHIRIIDTVDLPDKVSEDLPITKVGRCKSLFDDILIIESSKDSNILDLGSIVCRNDRTILGTVNDTFGQTTSPYYMVILRNKNIQVEMDEHVYCDIKHSTYITDQTIESPKITTEESEDEKMDELDQKQLNKLKQSYKDL